MAAEDIEQEILPMQSPVQSPPIDIEYPGGNSQELKDQIEKYNILFKACSFQELAIIWSVAIGFSLAYLACYLLKIDYGTFLHGKILYFVFCSFNIFAASQAFYSWAVLSSKSVARDYMFFLSIFFIGAAMGNSIDYILWINEVTQFKQSMFTNLVFVFAMLLAFPGIHFLGQVCRVQFNRQPWIYYFLFVTTYAMIPTTMNLDIMTRIFNAGSLETLSAIPNLKEFLFGVLYSMTGGYLASVSLYVWQTGTGKLVYSARLIALGMVAMSFGCAIYAGLFPKVPILEIPSNPVNMIIAMGYVLVACGVRRTQATIKILLALDTNKLPPAITLTELFGESEGLAVYRRLENNIKTTITELMKSREETQQKQEAIGELEREIKLRQKTEEQLLLAKERAEDASKAKSEFLAMMSHELKTPLTAIKGYSALLRSGSLQKLYESGKIAEIASQIESSSDTLKAMVEGLLEFSQLESGNYNYVKEVFLIQDLLPFIRSISDTHKKGFNADFRELITDPLLKLEADKPSIQHIISNLLVNAFKFSNGTPVTLEISKVGKDLVIVVTDDGIGISKEQQEKIFDAFYQVSLGTNRKYGGIGLGLSIVKKLVSGLNGEIRVESKLGSGSRFEVVLPGLVC
ncbi:MAG: HAMP domain-containing sensor histidine kinase [Candidatus Riflebacteria bacterium]